MGVKDTERLDRRRYLADPPYRQTSSVATTDHPTSPPGCPLALPCAAWAHTQAFAVGWSLTLLVLAREHLNSPPRRRIGALLSSSTYATYLAHQLVLFCATRALTTRWRVQGDSGGSNVLSLVALDALLSVVLSWALGMGLKTLPGLRRVL